MAEPARRKFDFMFQIACKDDLNDNMIFLAAENLYGGETFILHTGTAKTYSPFLHWCIKTLAEGPPSSPKYLQLITIYREKEAGIQVFGPAYPIKINGMSAADGDTIGIDSIEFAYYGASTIKEVSIEFAYFRASP